MSIILLVSFQQHQHSFLTSEVSHPMIHPTGSISATSQCIYNRTLILPESNQSYLLKIAPYAMRQFQSIIFFLSFLNAFSLSSLLADEIIWVCIHMLTQDGDILQEIP